MFADEEYLEEIKSFEDKFHITKVELEKFYKTYREMVKQVKGDSYNYKAIDAFICLFLTGKVEDLSKLYSDLGSPE